MKTPFRSATSGQKQTSPMDATGNFDNFENELDYVGSTSWDMEVIFCSATWM